MTAVRSNPPTSPTGDVDFDSIYRAHLDYVWHSLRRLGVADRDLEDLAHEVFVVVHRKLAEYDTTRPIRPWLFGIAFRVASDDRRRARHTSEIVTDHIEVAHDAPSAEQSIEAAQRREIVTSALATIVIEQRAVFVLHDIDGTPAPEIATALGVPLNTVYSRLRLAREKFAAAVREIQARRGEP